MLMMYAKPTAHTLFPRDDESYQSRTFNRRTPSFRFNSSGQTANQHREQPCVPRKMVYYYSVRFPNMCMNLSFYDDMMSIVDRHVEKYQSRWFDFDHLSSEPSLSDSSVPWDCPISRSVQPIHPPNEHSKKNNNNLKSVTNNHISNGQLPIELVSTSTPSSFESFSASTSSLDFEELITPTKEICKNDNDLKKSPEKNNNFKKSPEKNNNFKKSPEKKKKNKKLQEENNENLKILPEENNKINIIEDGDIKNESISSNSSRSDTADERIISYAEIIKCAKPKQSIKTEIITEGFKKEPTKSYRIPPSKKVSIKIPNCPFLPNNKYCVFCKNNGEEESVYRTHLVKDLSMNVKCPYLSMYTCPHCKATGTKAHTISRCPLMNKSQNNQFNKQ